MKRFTTLGALLAAALITGAAYAGPIGFSGGMSGDQEIASPEVVTDTTGKCSVKFNNDLSAADFKIDVSAGVGITQAHFHCAVAGGNGPVVAFLFPFDGAGVNVNGTLNSGTLTNASIIATTGTDACGTPLVNNIASLAAAMQNGRIYCNAHSTTYPAGEVRGQLLK
ncbi:MAG: CHRD domain-containing protein [Deltaproteobacteria bacterium]|nr:CHRD domain-containing protein [Deltaproteobacteria bacterium]